MGKKLSTFIGDSTYTRAPFNYRSPLRSNKYMKGIEYMSDHEIPLAIGLLKGISWVSSYYNSGLLLFNRVSSNY